MNRITKINRKTKNSLFFRLAVMILMTTGFTASGQNEFITTWQATGGTIAIPTTGTGYNYNIYWEEIGNAAVNGTATGRTGNYTISGLNSTRQYRVKISGAFPRIYFNDGGDKNKILTVEQWGNIAWTDMSNAFLGCSNLTVPAADAPDLSGVMSLTNMFQNATSLTVDHIDLWDVSQVQYMEGMFISCHNFNDNIGNWNVGNVTNMSRMFQEATSFNHDIGNWDVSKVRNMSVMFQDAVSFDQNISSWNVGNVTNMYSTFKGATAFNQNIGNWNVSRVRDMGYMFLNATSFNQALDNWDVGVVIQMDFMFENAISFNQNLGNWNVKQVSTMANMLNNSGLSKENYSLTLAGWASKNVTHVSLGAQGLQYDKNDAGRRTLRSKSWNITGDICLNCSFITTWQATGNSITIPTTGGGYNYNIYWEEIGNEVNNGNATATGNHTINTANANQYRVKITGQFPRIHFNDGGDKNKILTVEQWGDIAWTSMSEAFFGCSNLTVPAADAPDLSGVTFLTNMFRNATRLIVDHIDLWDVSHVQGMHGMFLSCHNFNDNVGGWDVSSVINMEYMFLDATSFNQDIGNWNVSNVANMIEMFGKASSFNQNIANWNVANVTNMGIMFDGATSFNQDISNWDVGNVTNMGGMFRNATIFNQDISNWDVSKVTDMNVMFQDATAFNQNLGNWNVIQVSTMANMLNNSGLSKENYSLTLAGWASKNVKTNVPLGAQGLEYYRNDAGRKALRSKSWNITGDNCLNCSFITTWQTTDGTITIPTIGGGYNYSIYWEEIGNVSNNGSVNGLTANYTITGLNTNQFRVKISGQFPRIFFDNRGDRNKILTIEQWGNIAWTNMANAFFGCSNLTIPAADAPDLSGVTSMQDMFRDATSLKVDHIDLWDVSNITSMGVLFWNATAFNDDISNWNVSNVTNMGGMFQGATSFNQDIGNWDVSKVTNMNSMFRVATSFNRDISNWNVGGVRNMLNMFSNATSFNQNIGTWDVSKVTDMGNMFQNATSFDQDIGNWDVGNVKYMDGMFWGATAFNQNLNSWNVGNVVNMFEMFRNASSFNQNIANWNVSNVTSMGGMFQNASTFNQAIGNWDVSKVQNMIAMFQNATAFDHHISNWNVSSVVSMAYMFWGAASFNGNIANWNVSSVSAMNGMFWDATAFNQDLSNWDVSSVTNMQEMFRNASSFNQDISAWNVGNVTNMGIMFQDAASFNQDISSWNVSNVTNMGGMFWDATAFNQDISNWDVSKVIYMNVMFENALVFNHNLGNWDVTKVATMDGIFNNSALSRENYELTLAGWASKNVLNNVPLGASGVKYCSETDRNTLISTKGWTITGDAKLCSQTITFNALPAQVYGDIFTLSATASSGLPVTYSSSDPSIASIVDNTITVHATGNITITATQSGDANNEAANSEQQSLTINPKPVTVTATSGQTKTYGEADPVLTYSVDQSLINGDVFSGTLGRTVGENVGTYSINQNTLTAGNNYTITFVSDDFTITPKAITVTTTPGQQKNYGDADPVLTYSVDQPLVNGDVFNGSLTRTVGENVGVYFITQHTLTAGSNYTITFVGDDFEIVPKTITVTATPDQHKTYGEADPVFTYSSDPVLASGDVFSGSLARIAGENVGTYAIHQNTLTAGNNYVIQFVSADFHIMKLDQIITFEPIPDKTVGGDSFTVVATASSALPLSFISSDETVVVISGDQVTIVGAGEVTITAIQAGDDIYNPQEETYTFTVHAGSLFIPTLFSPDGNGVNDLFLIRGTDIEEIHFVVFDMLGNEVYRAADVDTATRRGWDGTKGGVNQPGGTYLWSLRGKLRNGSTLSFEGKSSGQVVLMR